MFDTITSLFNSEWLYTAFAAVALGSTIVIVVVILSENRNPVKSLAWVTVLLLLPVVGLVLYMFFGCYRAAIAASCGAGRKRQRPARRIMICRPNQ